jgi:hypothetical protein
MLVRAVGQDHPQPWNKGSLVGTHSMRRTKATQIYSIARQATFVLSISSAIQNWRAPSVISESRQTMLYISPSKSSSSSSNPAPRLRTISSHSSVKSDGYSPESKRRRVFNWRVAFCLYLDYVYI